MLGIDADSRKPFDPMFESAKDEEWPGEPRASFKFKDLRSVTLLCRGPGRRFRANDNLVVRFFRLGAQRRTPAPQNPTSIGPFGESGRPQTVMNLFDEPGYAQRDRIAVIV